MSTPSYDPPAPSPGQTVGPFFHDALPYDGGPDLVPADHPGAIRLHGRVLDGQGDPVPDAMLELWQVDAAGDVPRRPGALRRGSGGDSGFTGWGRSATDDDGHYSFTTVTPGAPFFAIVVVARGLLDRLFTRAYLPTRADDPFLAGLEPERRASLVASADEGGFVFDVRLQGAGETVFLTYPGHRSGHASPTLEP